MTHPERKAVSDERERLIRKLDERFPDESWADLVRADAEKDEELAELRAALYDEQHGITATLRADALAEKDETIRRLREALRNLRDCCLETSDHGEAMKGATIELAATASPAPDTKDQP